MSALHASHTRPRQPRQYSSACCVKQFSHISTAADESSIDDDDDEDDDERVAEAATDAYEIADADGVADADEKADAAVGMASDALGS